MKHIVLLSLFIISIAHAGTCKLNAVTKEQDKFNFDKNEIEVSRLIQCIDQAKSNLKKDNTQVVRVNYEYFDDQTRILYKGSLR